MITDDHPADPAPHNPFAAVQPDDTINRLQELARVLREQEDQLAADLAGVKEKRRAAERILGVFTGTTPRKRRKPRKQTD